MARIIIEETNDEQGYRATVKHVPARAWTQPEGECTNCGEKSEKLIDASVTAYGVTNKNKLCQTCFDLAAPKPVVKDDTLYFADNGATYCGKHLGMTARYTGRDISGQKIAKVTKRDHAEWEKEGLGALTCWHCSWDSQTGGQT